MNTYLDCIPCFFRQILEGARIAHASPEVQKQLIDEFARRIPKVSLESSPPEIARIGYTLLKKISPDGDPYKEIKQKSNRLALKLYPKLKERVFRSGDRLLCAVELAIAGNVIDFGVKNNLDVDAELAKILAEEDKCIRKKSLFHYSEFKQALKKAENILYLADNAGETVFDRVLIEEMKILYPEKIIYYAVKKKPIINDALREDAEECKIHRIAQVISNGTDAPGTILSLCSKEFKEICRRSDMIISKGQGNYESLSSAEEPIFFLFMVKCPVVARDTGCKIGDAVLLCNPKQAGKKSGLKKGQK
jgi:uncharacterized protein with ATP-grasp and redox domains